MPRVPRPEEMPRAGLEPANEPPTININVASRIGQAGRSMGNAIEALGGAFGEVAGRIGQAQDNDNYARAKLETLKGYDGVDTDLGANAGEDGKLWTSAPERYKQVHEDVDTKYPISNPKQRADFQVWRDSQAWRRGSAAALRYQDAQRNQFVKGYEADLLGFEDRLSKGEVDPDTFNQTHEAMRERLNGLSRTVMPEAEVQQRTRELQGRLAGSLDRYLAQKDPAERERFWDTVRKGKYELDEQVGKQSSAGGGFLPVGGSMEGKTWDDVPRDGGAKNSREWGGPRKGGQHAGIDIPGRTGDPVLARDGGKVLFVGSGQGYGNMVDVQFPDGTVHRFGHLSNIAPGLRAGASLPPGAAVGQLGYSGNAGPEFPHVHLEVFKDSRTYEAAKGQSSRASWSMRMDPRAYYGAGSGGQQKTAQLSGLPVPDDVTQKISPEQYFAGKADVAKLPLGMRVSNNPTNIKFSGSEWQRQNFPGLEGPSKARDQGDAQAQFANPLAGMVAGVRLASLKQSQGMDTVGAIIAGPKGWTPGYGAAAQHIASLMGVGVNDKVDLSKPETMQKFMRAVITQEHGESGKLYSDDLIKRGVEVAMGGGNTRMASGGPKSEPPPVSERGVTSSADVPKRANADASRAADILERNGGGMDALSPADRATVYRGLYQSGILADLVGRGDLGRAITKGDPALEAISKKPAAERTPAEQQRLTQAAEASGLINNLVDTGQGRAIRDEGIKGLDPALAEKVRRGDKLTETEQNKVSKAFMDSGVLSDLVHRDRGGLIGMLRGNAAGVPKMMLGGPKEEDQQLAAEAGVAEPGTEPTTDTPKLNGSSLDPEAARRMMGEGAPEGATQPEGIDGEIIPPGKEPLRPTMIPMGRLAPGQVFEVKTPRGVIQIPGEWLNAIPAQTRAQRSKEAAEAFKIYERERQVAADESMRNGEAHVAAFGKLPPGYDAEAIKQAYRTNPRKIADHVRRMRIAGEIQSQLADASNLPDDEVVARLEQLRPQEFEQDFAERKTIFDQAEKRALALLKKREVDPGGSVETSKEVRSVREKLVGGVPRNVHDRGALADARMQAQTRIEVPEQLRSPISADEARALGTALRASSQGNAMAEIEKLYKRAGTEWGQRHAEAVVRSVIRTSIRDGKRREAYDAMLSGVIDDQDRPPPAAAAPPGPTLMERAMGWGRSVGEFMGGAGLGVGDEGLPPDAIPKAEPDRVYPAPPPAAIRDLKANPHQVDEFNKKYGNGAAEKAVPGIRRLLLLNQ